MLDVKKTQIFIKKEEVTMTGIITGILIGMVVYRGIMWLRDKA
jgi:hypothetical protein